MELVIEISEEYYNDICNSETVSSYSVLYALDGIGNGTPLPKGHGKIVDVDTIDLNQDEFISQSDYYAAECAIENAPTIIEADKTEKEVKVKAKENDLHVGDEVITGNGEKGIITNADTAYHVIYPENGKTHKFKKSERDLLKKTGKNCAICKVEYGSGLAVNEVAQVFTTEYRG